MRILHLSPMRISLYFSKFMLFHFIGSTNAFKYLPISPSSARQLKYLANFQSKSGFFGYPRTKHHTLHVLYASPDSDSSSRASSNLNGVFLLNFVAILWGTQHVCIKSSVESFGTTSLVNFWRFLMSSAIFLPPFVNALVQETL